VTIEETVSNLLASLDSEAKLIFALKMANLPDREIASRLEVSRPTVSIKKAACLNKIREELHTVEADLHQAILSETHLRILDEELSA
jgi:DNA-directed RNA polymerase specialized sigma24 family protein